MMREPGWAAVLLRLLDAETAATARFASLATLTVNGRPSVRTVVFRGLYQGTRDAAPMLQIATDARSAKVDGLRHCNWAELCWYFTEAREQLRFTGHVAVVDGDEGDAELARARCALWRSLSPNARNSFLAPPPGAPVTGEPGTDPHFSERVDGETDASQQSGGADVKEAVDWFALLLFKASKVDHLKLRSNERRMWTVAVNGEWDNEAVHP